MMTFKKISENGSKISYKVSAVGIDGIIVIDKDSDEIYFDSVSGFLSDSETEKNNILYHASKRIRDCNFADKVIYATH
ncbi:hypothetical protein TRPE111910_11870 [Treponema peruense]